MESARCVVDFLQAELNVIDLKIKRLESALDACERCSEREGLQALLHSAYVEREVINHLLECQTGDSSVSLDAQIMERIRCVSRRISQQSRNWRRGKPTPAGYWEAEVRRTMLNELMNRFHAWQHHREPLTALEQHEHRRAVGANNIGKDAPEIYAHPWYMVTADVQEKVNGNGQNGNGNGRANGHKRGYSRSAEMLFEDVSAALERADLPLDHLEVIAEPLGNVIVTGYAHDADQHRRFIDTILGVDGVFEVIEDIKEVDRAECPICRSPDPVSANGQHRNGRRNGNHPRRNGTH